MVGISVPNRPGAPRGTAGIMPRGRDRWHRTGPLAIVRCRARYWEDGWARWTAGPYTLGHSWYSETHVISATYADGRDSRTAGIVPGTIGGIRRR